MKTLIIYHAGCPDGYCAAWIVHRYLRELGQDAELWPARYADPAPSQADVEGRQVYIVDFSYDRATMERLSGWADQFCVFDHHATAQANLEGLPGCVFDMDESGASLTWQQLYPGKPLPWLVEYVKDRDLWRWDLPESQAVSAFLMAVPHELEEWDDLAAMEVTEAIMMGRAIRLHVDEYVKRAGAHAFLVELDGQPMRCVNAPYMNISDVLHELCSAEYPVALGFFWRGDKWQYSMRALEGHACRGYAEARGGGGHKDAAGFESQELIPEIADALRSQR